MSPPIMPTRILLVGGGGREHALAWKLGHEPGVNEVIVAPGSDAIALEPRVRVAPDVDPLDGAALVALTRREAAELVVIGPEAPLAAGVVDALAAAGIATFGPTRAAARVESSKAFCREVAEAAGVPMARGRAFDEPAAARAFAADLVDTSGGAVVKADGLAAGKGVTVCTTVADADSAIDALFATSGPRVVVEERLEGREASLIALTDGRTLLGLPPARDHKRLGDDDTGPNTGGMGAYSPLPDLPDEAAERLLETVHRPVLAELARRGTPFTGALYAGLMLTASGPRLLEFNARFGDPETQAVLPRLAVPLGPLLLAAARGRLAAAAQGLGLHGTLLPTVGTASVVIVLAADGYPDRPVRGDAITGLDAARAIGGLVFHAGTRRDPDGTWRTNGGRVLAAVGRGADIEAARRHAEQIADSVAFAGMQRRHDIGVVAAPASVAPAAAGAGR